MTLARISAYAFAADVETRISVKDRKGYLLHYHRIVKMRFQEHAHGDHLVKIYSAPADTQSALLHPASDKIGIERETGGVFVSPSIHRHLSSLAARTGLNVDVAAGSSI